MPPAMPARAAPPPAPPSTQRRGQSEGTNVWGSFLEKGHFLKVPKVWFLLGRHGGEKGQRIKPRHVLLLPALASKKYKTAPIRVYWEALAIDLASKPDTVRKWAYELRKMGLLKITQHRGRDPKDGRPGVRNDRNSFDLAPLVVFLESAKKTYRKGKKKREDPT